MAVTYLIRRQPSTYGVGPSQTIQLVIKIAARSAAASSAVEQNRTQPADFFHNLRSDTAGGFAETLAQLLVVQFHYPALHRAEDAKCGR